MDDPVSRTSARFVRLIVLAVAGLALRIQVGYALPLRSSSYGGQAN
jgi:hypothetical protein